MSVRDGDRVMVRGQHPGQVVGKPTATTAYVRLDSGSAANYPLTDVDPLADLSWPPTLETK